MARIPKNLREAEERLLVAARDGEALNLQVGEPAHDDPANGATWPESRSIRAEVIYHLLVDRPEAWSVHAKGILLTGARVEGQLDLESATLDRPIWLFHCYFEASINLQGTTADTIGLGGSFLPGLNGNGIVVHGLLNLTGVRSAGKVQLPSAKIGRALVCTGAQLESPRGVALYADSIVIGGNVFLDGKFEAQGEVRLLGAEIGGQLSCSGGNFTNPGGIALNADGLMVKGGLFLNEKFEAQGEVRLLGAEIGGQLSCIGGNFWNEFGNALSADGATIKRSVSLGGCFRSNGHDEGAIRLVGLEVGGQLSFLDGIFENANGIAVNLQDAKVLGSLFWEPKSLPIGSVDLRHAECAVLNDDLDMYPDHDIRLEGFHYGALSPATNKKSFDRLIWLRKQRKISGEFARQPYEHLANVFRFEGRSSDARKVAIALQDDLRRSGVLNRREAIWNWLLGFTIGHGWTPMKVLPFIGFFLIAGTAFFYGAFATGAMRPAKERAYMWPDYVMLGQLPKHYPEFNPLIYSIDVFIPIVDLRQESYWLPRYSKKQGWIYVIYMWLHIAMGWILTTLGVVGLTGIVKKE